MCDDLCPTTRARTADPLRDALLVAIGLTALVVLAMLDPCTDLRPAMGGATFWLKLGTTA